MSSLYRRALLAALVCLMSGFGSSFSQHASADDDYYCEDNGPRRWSEEWYQMHADSPVGTRQKYKYGKFWPPFSRPTGPKQPCMHQYHAAHYWPLPYVCADRAYVRDSTNLQVNKGWDTETTLYEYHFGDDNQALERSGRMRLEWILKHVPPDHRVVWVQTGENSETSQARLAAVQATAAEMIGDSGDVPPIMLRAATPVGRPAIEIDMTRKLELSTIPEPRVHYEALPSGTSGGGN